VKPKGRVVRLPSVPFAVIIRLTFTAPDLSDGSPKFIYVLITYILSTDAAYSGIQIPITAILPNLAAELAERHAREAELQSADLQ
jgi:Na+/melibiose symporter-like transporter